MAYSGDGKPPRKAGTLPLEKRRPFLNELENLTRMLGEDNEDTNDLEDLPVLKSFVEDVPVLSDRFDDVANKQSQISDKPDHRFLDDDPLAISESVRNRKQGTTPTPVTADPEPSPAEPSPRRFAPATKPENPFLPRSALDRLREVKDNTASQELRSLINQSKTQVPQFNTDPNSSEYKHLRNKASQLVNDIIRSQIPRIEAELRMRLETEVDTLFKALRQTQSPPKDK